MTLQSKLAAVGYSLAVRISAHSLFCVSFLHVMHQYMVVEEMRCEPEGKLVCLCLLLNPVQRTERFQRSGLPTRNYQYG